MTHIRASKVQILVKVFQRGTFSPGSGRWWSVPVEGSRDRLSRKTITSTECLVILHPVTSKLSYFPELIFVTGQTSSSRPLVLVPIDSTSFWVFYFALLKIRQSKFLQGFGKHRTRGGTSVHFCVLMCTEEEGRMHFCASLS